MIEKLMVNITAFVVESLTTKHKEIKSNDTYIVSLRD